MRPTMNKKNQFGARRPVRAGEIGAENHLFGDLGVDRNARKSGMERCRLDVGESRGARADEQDRPLYPGAVEISGEYLPSRDEPYILFAGLVEPDSARRIGRHRQPTDLDAYDACLLSKGLFATRTGAFDQQRRRPPGPFAAYRAIARDRFCRRN